MWQDNDPEHKDNATKEFLMARESIIWPQKLSDLNPTDHVFLTVGYRLQTVIDFLSNVNYDDFKLPQLSFVT